MPSKATRNAGVSTSREIFRHSRCRSSPSSLVVTEGASEAWSSLMTLSAHVPLVLSPARRTLAPGKSLPTCARKF